jgi:hypothetical protein
MEVVIREANHSNSVLRSGGCGWLPFKEGLAPGDAIRTGGAI